MTFLANIALFKVAWLSSVIGAANEMPWLGPVAVLVALAVHLRVAHKPFEEVVLAALCALIGASFDSLLVATGLVTYSSGTFSAWLAPYWIVTMWILFATTLNVSMRWLRGKPLAAALLGLVGGPAAYTAGEALGGIVLLEPVAARIALGLGWAIIMPALAALAAELDGMPGGRRRWPAEHA